MNPPPACHQRSLRLSLSHANTHAGTLSHKDTHPDRLRHTHTATHSLQHTMAQGRKPTHTPTFISSRQLAMEYMTRLRRDCHSLRDAKNRERRRRHAFITLRVTSYFHFSGCPYNVTLFSPLLSLSLYFLTPPPPPNPHARLYFEARW